MKKIIFIVFSLVLFFVSIYGISPVNIAFAQGCSVDPCPGVAPICCSSGSCTNVASMCPNSWCGDNNCEGGENSSNCSVDCGLGSSPSCGNAQCENWLGENPDTCRYDCGGGGDGIISCNSVGSQCPAAAPICCPDDSASPGSCLNEAYYNTNGCNPNPSPYCGDNACNGSEDSASCPGDCLSGLCGNNTCDAGETALNCSADCGAPTPNLIAASPSPSTATVGVAQTFSSTITNNGTAGTGASFSNFFQRATAANGGGTITAFTSTTMTALANGASNTATSPSYTFPSAGTYSVRACADKTNAASTGTIAESNEGDNCSAWTNVVVGTSCTNVTNVRVLVHSGLQSYSRIVELEAWGGGGGTDNFALSGTASASSQFSANFPATSAINGDKRGVGWGGGTGGWNDSTAGVWDDWLGVAFSSPKNLNAINVYTLSDSVTLPSDPSPTDTFSQYGITNFDVQTSANNGSSWTTIPGGSVTGNNLIWRNFACGPTPNLIAASPSPSTATVGVAQTFSSTITNNGTAGTGASFSNFFQRATAANGGGTITAFTSTTMTALANGASNTATSPSYTFPSAGTYSVRACADKTNAASTGTIAESNEGDNCSAWTNVVVSVAVSVSVNITSPAEGSNSLNSNIPINWTTTGSGLNCLMWFTEGGPQMPYTSCPSGANTTQLSYVHMPIISGRVLAMDFVENAGITTYDRSANGNNGTLVNATWTTSGKYGKALNFNGINGYVNLGTNASLRPSGAFSAVAWINANASQVLYPQIVSSGDSSGIAGWNLYLQNGANQGAAAFIVKEGSNAWGNCYALGTSNLKGAGWKFVVGVYDGVTAKIYVDGVPQTTDACQNQSINYGTSPSAEIGRKIQAQASTYFNGTIDEVAVYNRALTATEIGNMYNDTAFNGAHTLNIRATDSSAQTATDSNNFTISVAPMSGTLTPASPSCIIASGASTCNINYSWTTTNPVATSAVTSDTNNSGASSPNFNVANGNNGGPAAFIIPYGGRTFYLYNNTVLLAQSTIAAGSVTCTGGTTWNGSICAVNPITVSLGANPTSMALPTNATTLSWVTTGNPTSCTASGWWSGAKTVSGGSENRTGLNPGVYTYVITCSKAGTPNAVSTVEVTVLSAPTVTFNATPTSIFTGNSTTLTWSSSAGSCTGTNFSTGGATSGSVSVSPTSTITYSITCDGVTSQVTVVVRPKPTFIEN